MDHQSSLSMDPNCSREMRFAFRFMGALARIKRTTTTRQQPLQRCSTRRIKLAADASMATTIGYRRRWGRALLFKLHNQQAKKRRACLVRRRKVLRIGHHDKEKKLIKRKKKKIDIGYGGGDHEEDKVLQAPIGGDDHELVIGKVDRLRRLLPGGETMDFCKLLEETSHYIKCLNTQVQVMKNIADIYTSGTTTTPSTKT